MPKKIKFESFKNHFLVNANNIDSLCENKKCKNFLVDIFNLIFGSGNETDDFWIKILEKKLITTDCKRVD